MDATGLYEEIVNQMGTLAATVVDMVDDSIREALQSMPALTKLKETEKGKNYIKIAGEANEKAQDNINILYEVLDSNTDHFFNIPVINSDTLSLNRYTRHIDSLNKDLDLDYFSGVVPKFERKIINLIVKEYKGKVDLIYNLLSDYKRNPVNIKQKTVSIWNKERTRKITIPHNTEDIILPEKLD